MSFFYGQTITVMPIHRALQLFLAYSLPEDFLFDFDIFSSFHIFDSWLMYFFLDCFFAKFIYDNDRFLYPFFNPKLIFNLSFISSKLVDFLIGASRVE